MKNLTLASTIFVTIFAAAPVMAADIASQTYSWTGGYLGLDAGATINNSTWSGPTFPTFNTNGTGGYVGGVAGYRYQMENNLVLGAELSGGWSGVQGQANCASPVGPFPTCHTDQDFLGMAQLNIGYAADRLHVYVGGGAAVADYKYYETVSLAQSWNGGLRLGWTVGAGLDYAVNPSWIAGIRYNYYDFGSQTNSGGIGPTAVTFGENGHLITARLEYKF